MPYIITQSNIKKVLQMKDMIKIMEQVFRLHGQKKTQQPPKSYLTFNKGDLRSMPAYINSKSMNTAGIKCVNVHPENKRRNLPTVMATILLIDPRTGYNIALLDGTYITDLRTGAAGALAAKYLAKKNSRMVGLVGAGQQARTQLDGLMFIRPIRFVKVYDIDRAKARNYCRWAENKYPIKAIAVKTVKEAVVEVDIVVTTTPSRRPLVKADYVSPGTHINAIGADAEGKQELESKLTKKSVIVIDEWEQASHSGEINVPVSRGIIKKKNIYAELGRIVAGYKKGRFNDKIITIFDSTGLALQDISAAFVAYERLMAPKYKKRLLRVKLF